MAKFIWCFLVTISLAVGSDVSTYDEAKFIGALFFGYTCFRMWGKDKPMKYLNFWWFLMQPFLFSTIGATLVISNLKGSIIGYAILVIICGLCARLIAAYFVSVEKRFVWKEKLFIALCWIPKATVQAVLSSIFLQKAK